MEVVNKAHHLPPSADLLVCTSAGRSAAERFRELTGRPLVPLDEVEDVDRFLRKYRPGTALLSLGPTSVAWTRSLVLTAHSTGTNIGWVFGWGSEDDAVAHAEKVATARFRRSSSGLLWSSSPLGTVRDARTGGMRIISGPRPDVVELATEPRMFTALISHGIGIDMRLGVEMLCSRESFGSEVPSGLRVHPCMQGGPCMRAEHGPYGLMNPGRYDVRAVAAEVLVLASCRSLRLTDNTPSLSLASAAARGPNAPVLFGTIGDIQGLPAVQLLAFLRLCQGVSAGEMLRLENVASLAATGAAPWVLLGDPLAVPGGRLSEQRGSPDTSPVSDRLLVIEEQNRGVPVIFGSAIDEKAKTWADVVPGCGTRIVVAQGLGIDRIEVCDPVTDAPSRLRETMLGASRALATSRAFIATAASLLTGVPRVEATELLGAFDRWLERLRGIRADAPNSVARGGWEDERRRWYDAESAEWSRLQDRIAHTASTFCSQLGPLHTAFHVDSRRVMGRDARAETVACPYCGAPAEWRPFELPTLPQERKSLHCWSCELVFDGSTVVDLVVLRGPPAVPAGSARVYTLDFGTHEPQASAAEFAIERVPWGTGVHQTPYDADAVRTTGAHRSAYLLRFDDGPPGLYFLVASVVMDGELMVVRRPLQLLSGRPASRVVSRS